MENKKTTKTTTKKTTSNSTTKKPTPKKTTVKKNTTAKTETPKKSTPTKQVTTTKTNKKSLIVGFIATLLALLIIAGVTYAYYRTRIIGNNATTSMQAQSAVYEIEYEDDGMLAGDNNVKPGYTLEKTFSVKNNGLLSSYVVVLENVINEFNRKYDLTYTLECTSVNSKTNAVSGTCEGVSKTRFPATNDRVIIQSNELAEGITHNYKLTITYANLDDIDQSEDMGKSFSAKINIANLADINPYSDNKETLAYNILNNSINNKNGTELIPEPMSDLTAIIRGESAGKVTFTIPYTGNLEPMDGSDIPETCEEAIGKEMFIPYGNEYIQAGNLLIHVWASMYIISCDGDIATVESRNDSYIVNESSLISTQDDYGTTYYYRGLVADNYVNYSGMCFRIVRIQGDGSVKLILEDSSNKCENSFQDNEYSLSKNDITNVSTTKLKNETWCVGNMRDAYDSVGGNIIGKFSDIKNMDDYDFSVEYGQVYYSINLEQDSLICDMTGTEGETFKATIGSLTVNEVVHAGQGGNGYLGVSSFATLSNHYYAIDDFPYEVLKGAVQTSYMPYGSLGNRPVIVLKEGTTITSGDGTKNTPYVIAS